MVYKSAARSLVNWWSNGIILYWFRGRGPWDPQTLGLLDYLSSPSWALFLGFSGGTS